MLHPYRVKELLWVIIVALFVLVALVGCSTAPTGYKPTAQFCYTKKTVEVVDGSNVSSKTVVECDDSPIGQVAKTQPGIDRERCREYLGHQIGEVRFKGVTCEIDSQGNRRLFTGDMYR
jgi:hypothetical protein